MGIYDLLNRASVDNQGSSNTTYLPAAAAYNRPPGCGSIFDSLRAAQSLAIDQNAPPPTSCEKKRKKGEVIPERTPQTVEPEVEEEGEDKMRTRKRVKIKGFKDIGKEKAREDLLSICWCNSAKGKELLRKLDKVDPRMKIGSAEEEEDDVDSGDDNVGKKILDISKAVNKRKIKDYQCDLPEGTEVIFDHPCERSPYRIDTDSTFGGLIVELDNEARTVTYYPRSDKNDKVIHKLELGPFMNILDLLTKRIKLKYDYDKESIELFCEIVNKSGFRQAKTSKKFRLVRKYNKKKLVEAKAREVLAKAKEVLGGALVGNGEQKSLKASGEGLSKTNEYAKIDNDIMIMRPENFKSGVSRFNVLVQAIKTGNKGSKIKDELKLIYNYLWDEAKKDNNRGDFFREKVMPKYRDV